MAAAGEPLAGMRILIATDSYPPLIGGATQAGRLLAQELGERGHAVRVVTLLQPNTAAEEDDDGIPVTRLRASVLRSSRVSADPYRRVPPPFPDPELTYGLRRVIAEFRPDVVHSYGWLSYSCAVAAGRSTPLLLSARDYGNICAVRTLVRHGERCSGPAIAKCLECAGSFYGRAKGTAAVVGVLAGRGLLRRRMDGLHSVSRFVEDQMRHHLLDGRDVAEAVLPDFRSADGGAPADVRLPGLPERYIVFVGALRRVKGVDVLLDAWGGLDDPPALVLVGTRAPDTPAAFPDGVHVVYDAPGPAVMRAFDCALFAVAPSVWAEPLGNVVHEAQSRGRAVIGTAPGGHEDMIEDGVDGLLVPPGDVLALRAAMQRLLTDPELASRMGAVGRRNAARYTAASVVPAFEALYRELRERSAQMNAA